MEAVRHAFEHFERGDIYEWLKFFDEDALWVPADMPDIEPIRGKEAILELMQSYLEPWDDLRFDGYAFEESGDSVCCTVTQTVTQQSTDLSFSDSVSGVFDFRDDLVVRVRWYWDADEARAALGSP